MGLAASMGAFLLTSGAQGRGLHSPTFRLNVSAFYGIGGALCSCLGVVWQVSRVVMASSGCILCQKGLKLS